MRLTLATALAALLLAAPAAAETLLIGNKGEDTLSLVALSSGTELARLPTGRMPHEIAVSPDGKQAAVVAWASRSPRLTPSRTEELAEIAESILPPDRTRSTATPALLGVAQWLLGRRELRTGSPDRP